ncbi:MAG: hypothetical protein GX589_00270, partial [Deltaproteobacteria bacterium]|nr:hypothetical protein [Deltaproteobacteria bacterium]
MRKLETTLLSWLGLVFFFVLVFPLYAQEQPSCGIAAEALKEASRIRGLKIKREVSCQLQSQEEVKAHLLKVIAEKMPSGRLELEGAVYEAFGLIPDGYAYKEGILEMYMGQIGGYYDSEKKHYVMAAWLPGAMQVPIAVHELTHALQD